MSKAEGKDTLRIKPSAEFTMDGVWSMRQSSVQDRVLNRTRVHGEGFVYSVYYPKSVFA